MSRWGLLVVVVAACAGPESVGERSAAISGGSGSENDSVVQTFASSGTTCSGVVIGPRHVLSSKSCVFTGAAADPLIRVIGGVDVAAPTFTATVVETVATPGEFDATVVPNNDVVVLITDEELSVPALPLADTAPAADDVLTIIGYGAGSLTSGIRNEAEITVTRVEDDVVLAEGNDASLCSGDGPALDATGAVVAFATFVYSEDGGAPGCPAFGNGLRDLTQYREFIEDALTVVPEDAGVSDDAGAGDSGVDAAAMSDAGTEDAGMSGGSGGGCSATGTPSAFSLLVLALLWRRRR